MAEIIYCAFKKCFSSVWMNSRYVAVTKCFNRNDKSEVEIS